MALTTLDTELNIIAALDDEPNDIDGLTAAQLKAKFDEGGLAIKTFLNDTLIPETEAEITRQVENAVMASGNVLLKVGGTEPETGPCVWIDTSVAP